MNARMILLVALVLVSGCQATTSTGVDENLQAMQARIQTGQSASGLLFFSQDERMLAFKHIDRLYPTRTVNAGDSPFPLGEDLKDISDTSYELDGETYTVSDFVAMPSNRGMLVVQGGDVLYEHYSDGNDRDTRWISFSVTKSVTSMLIGAAIQDGFIRDVDEPVAHYLPRLRGTGYEQATIRNVLQMSSGLAWNEDYADPNSDVARAGGANGLQLVQYLAQLEQEHEPGTKFNYNTGETNLVGEILRAAIGNNAATYLTHKIWEPFGMESDATWLTGGAGAGETGGCCISATLRDYARIGIFAMGGGVLPDGTRVLPENWMAESITPSAGAPFYGYLWWLYEDGAYAAQGIFGQWIFIDPKRDLVIALHSNAPTAVRSDYSRHIGPMFRAVSGSLR